MEEISAKDLYRENIRSTDRKLEKEETRYGSQRPLGEALVSGDCGLV